MWGLLLLVKRLAFLVVSTFIISFLLPTFAFFHLTVNDLQRHWCSVIHLQIFDYIKCTSSSLHFPQRQLIKNITIWPSFLLANLPTRTVRKAKFLSMGTYLSTPVTDKCSEQGESLDVTKTNVVCRWGVVDQQGWRKSMEDAHVAVTDIPLKGDGGGGGGGDAARPPTASTEPVDAKVFGVFDGHGGAEVARFCQLYLVSVLKQQPTWKDNTTGLPTTPDDPSIPTDPDDLDSAGQTAVGMALRSTFHALDRMIDDPEWRYGLFVHC